MPAFTVSLAIPQSLMAFTPTASCTYLGDNSTFLSELLKTPKTSTTNQLCTIKILRIRCQGCSFVLWARLYTVPVRPTHTLFTPHRGPPNLPSSSSRSCPLDRKSWSLQPLFILIHVIFVFMKNLNECYKSTSIVYFEGIYIFLTQSFELMYIMWIKINVII